MNYDYWITGTSYVEAELERAKNATYADMPIGSDPGAFSIWKATRIEALNYALEMMGYVE